MKTSINYGIMDFNRILTNMLAFIFICVITSVWFVPSVYAYSLIILVIADFMYIIFNFQNINIPIKIENILFIVFFIFLFVGAFIGGNRIDALVYVLTFALFFLNFILLTNHSNWTQIMYFSLKILSLIFIIGSILQIVNPNLLLEINSFRFTSEDFSRSSHYIINDIFIGFTLQTGSNGFFLSIGSIIIFTEFLVENHKTKRILLLIAYVFVFYFIFLTQKRGFIIFNTLILLYVSAKFVKNKMIVIFFTILFIITFLFIIFNTGAGENLVMRTMLSSDASSGRFNMYRIMWSDFLESPLIGKGTYTTIDMFEAGNGHNIYLQILRENGIIGLITFILILIVFLYKGQKLLDSANMMNSKDDVRITLASIQILMLFILWGFTGNPVYDIISLVTFFVAISMITVLNKKYNYK